MTTVPPPTTPPPQTTAAPPAAPVVQIVSPTPAVTALPPGTVLEAVVVPSPPQSDATADAKPTVVLRTPVGDVTVRLPARLPDNARVALEVLRTASATQQTPQTSVRVVTIDNQPAAQVLAQLARQNVDARAPLPLPLLQVPPNDPQNPLLRSTALPVGTAWSVNGPMPMPNLGTVSAFVILGNPAAATPEALLTALSTSPNATPNPNPTINNAPLIPAVTPAPAAAPTAANVPPLSLTQNSEVSLRIASVTLPGSTTPMPAAPTASASATPAAQTNAVSTPLGVTTPPPAVTPPAMPTGFIITGGQGMGPVPPQPPQTVQMPPVLGTFTGAVVAQGPSGAPIIEIANGQAGIASPQTSQIQVNVRANLPIGTLVTLEVTAHFEPRIGTPLPPSPASALPLSGPPGLQVGWPALSESIAILQRSDPQAAQQLAQAVPDGGARTAAALISFAQAMRSGDARQWPGDSALRALERAGPRGSHLASQLSDEVSALSSRARDTGTEWRALPIPWNADGHIDRITLISRREGEADEDGKKKSGGGGTRFLIDLDLSRLGPLQLDGMFRRETKSFDLMIRTKAALDEKIRTDLLGIFASSNAAMGLKGGLTFQIVKKFADPLNSGPFGQDKSGVWA
jgi:hypothetical protein